MKNPFEKFYYYFKREKNPERAHFIAKEINDLINRVYYCFPDKELSELASWFNDLYNKISKIIENNSKRQLIVLENIKERHFRMYREKIQTLYKDERLTPGENRVILGIYNLIDNINQQLKNIFLKRNILSLFLLLLLKESEVLHRSIIITDFDLARDIREFYKIILKRIFLEVINNIEINQGIKISNNEEDKEQIVENYIFYFSEDYYNLIQFIDSRIENLIEKIKEGYYEDVFKNFLTSQKEKTKELEFYTQLAENYINDLREEFIRADNYQPYQEMVDYFLNNLKKIIINLKIVPKNLLEFRGIILYLADKLFYLFTDEKIMELIFKIKYEDLKRILNHNKPDSVKNKEIEIYISEMSGIPFYEDILKEILIRIYSKLPPEKRFLRRLITHTENLSELDLINNLTDNYIKKNIGVGTFSKLASLIFKYAIYIIQRTEEDRRSSQ